MTLGLDCSTTTCGWAFSENKFLLDAGFLDISKIEKNKDKCFFIIDEIKKNLLFPKITKINLEAALSGFASGLTSQQTVIMLSRFNAVLEYILSEYFKLDINLINVNTARKNVLGKARIKGMKPKEYVKSVLPSIVPNISKFEKLNRDGNWHIKNGDMYDAVVISLYG